MTHDRILGQSQELAERLTQTLHACFPDDSRVIALSLADRVLIQSAPNSAQELRALPRPHQMPLFVDGKRVAEWTINMHMVLDRSGQFLKTVESALVLKSVMEKTPLVRLEYRSDMRTAPISHWQFHAERGAFSHMLAVAHAGGSEYVTDRPHSLSSLHFPVGGERFRPSIEDFIEFLIRECGVDKVDGWDQALRENRELWRRMQLRAAVRDLQAEAAERLRDEGWTVAPPADFKDVSDESATLVKW